MFSNRAGTKAHFRPNPMVIVAVIAGLAVYFHFRDAGSPPPSPFPIPPRDEAAEQRYNDAADELRGIVIYPNGKSMDSYKTGVDSDRLALIGFEPARRDIARLAKHIEAAKAFLSICEVRFDSSDEPCSSGSVAIMDATKILLAAVVQARMGNRPDEAVSLLENFGPQRLDIKGTNLTMMDGMFFSGACDMTRATAVQLAYVETSSVRLRRLLSLVESVRIPNDLFRRTLGGEYSYTVRSVSGENGGGAMGRGTLPRALYVSGSLGEVGNVLKSAWLSLNTLPNSTAHCQANRLLRIVETPETVPVQIPEFSFWDRKIGRNCGGIGVIERTSTDYGLVRDWLGRRSVACHSLARTAVALRIYEIAHGKRPDALTALVPDILPAVPTDPYDGKPVRYDAAKGHLWCLGQDLEDDTGNMEHDGVLHLPGCEPPDAVSVFDQEKRRGTQSPDAVGAPTQ